MSRKQLRQLAANPDFISGIHNYCDRWCERCSFSSRCFVYATEKADLDLEDPDVRDLNNAKFWRKLESIFKDAHELIHECAAEAGVDLDAIDAAEEIAAHAEKTKDARRHEFSLLARNYAGLVQGWFANDSTLAQVQQHLKDLNPQSAEAEIDITAAVEIIRWYQFFIAAKVFRALLGDDDELGDIYHGNGDITNPAQTDANGSAKIALIAIDRSFSAWHTMQTYFPDMKDSIATMMIALETLRKGVEETLPLARDFVRPGFDEVTSEFAS